MPVLDPQGARRAHFTIDRNQQPAVRFYRTQPGNTEVDFKTTDAVVVPLSELSTNQSTFAFLYPDAVIDQYGFTADLSDQDFEEMLLSTKDLRNIPLDVQVFAADRALWPVANRFRLPVLLDNEGLQREREAAGEALQQYWMVHNHRTYPDRDWEDDPRLRYLDRRIGRDHFIVLNSGFDGGTLADSEDTNAAQAQNYLGQKLIAPMVGSLIVAYDRQGEYLGASALDLAWLTRNGESEAFFDWTDKYIDESQKEPGHQDFGVFGEFYERMEEWSQADLPDYLGDRALTAVDVFRLENIVRQQVAAGSPPDLLAVMGAPDDDELSVAGSPPPKSRMEQAGGPPKEKVSPIEAKTEKAPVAIARRRGKGRNLDVVSGSGTIRQVSSAKDAQQASQGQNLQSLSTAPAVNTYMPVTSLSAANDASFEDENVVPIFGADQGLQVEMSNLAPLLQAQQDGVVVVPQLAPDVAYITTEGPQLAVLSNQMAQNDRPEVRTVATLADIPVIDTLNVQSQGRTPIYPYIREDSTTNSAT